VKAFMVFNSDWCNVEKY